MFHTPAQKCLQQPLGIRADTLIPCQQPTSMKLLRSADCYQLQLLKHPHLSVFHSYAEYLHALLLEADPAVSSFVPQPFTLYLQGRRYTPDCYVMREGKPWVYELKPDGQMHPASVAAIEQFFQCQGMHFAVIDNQTICDHEREALHWLPLIQTLVLGQRSGIDTSHQEQQLWQACLAYDADPVVQDLLPMALRAQQPEHELALLRLIHRQQLRIDLSNSPFNAETELKRW